MQLTPQGHDVNVALHEDARIEASESISAVAEPFSYRLSAKHNTCISFPSLL
jgi:hypothetical protein